MFTHSLLRSFNEDSNMEKIAERPVNTLACDLFKRHNPQCFTSL